MSSNSGDRTSEPVGPGSHGHAAADAEIAEAPVAADAPEASDAADAEIAEADAADAAADTADAADDGRPGSAEWSGGFGSASGRDDDPVVTSADDLFSELDDENDEASGVEADAEQVAEELDELEQMAAERDQFKDLAQRVQADFENYRRRVTAQNQVELDRATAKLAGALLPVLDAAEAAYVRHPDEVGPLLNQILVELRKQGLEVIDLDGQPFDPNLAEAVAHEPGEGGEVVVAEVLRSGYTWKGRTLRPAMVRTKD